jgi:hypothetical protein
MPIGTKRKRKSKSKSKSKSKRRRVGPSPPSVDSLSLSPSPPPLYISPVTSLSPPYISPVTSLSPSPLDENFLEMIETMKKMDLGIDIIVKAAIWGHGEQINEVFTPKENIQLNLEGAAMSGVCTLGKKDSNLLIDEFLQKTDIWPIPTDILEEEHHSYAIEFEKRIKKIIKTKTKKGDQEGIKDIIRAKLTRHLPYVYLEDYGNSEKQRGDKTYTGEHNRKTGSFIALGVPEEGPLLKIYKITCKKGDEIIYEIELPSPNEQILKNGVKLSEITEIISQIISEMVVNLQSTIPFDIHDVHKLFIHLFDPSCNFSEYEPIIATLTKGKKKVTI